MPKTQSCIHFHSADTPVALTERNRLKAFLRNRFEQEAVPLAQLAYIFCSDEYLLDINIRFLNHDFLTDIITFPLQEAGKPVNSEIYISLDRVRENASIIGQTFKSELLRVIFHGALHLIGYNDKTRQQQSAMRNMENKWLKEYELFHVEH